jgi:regulator of RNase E activity RraA
MLTDEQAELKARLLELDTAAVSDAMDSLGCNRALAGIAPRVDGVKLAGPVYTVQYEPFDSPPTSFQSAGNYIDDVPAGCVLLIDNHGNTLCTNWGDILTRKALMQGIAGTVINGSARDIALVRSLEYPLFTKGVYMVSGKNRVRVTAVNVPVTIGDVQVEPGDWMFGDDNGVLVLPAHKIAEILARAEQVLATEADIIRAIEGGSKLDTARMTLGYATPWNPPNGH